MKKYLLNCFLLLAEAGLSQDSLSVISSIQTVPDSAMYTKGNALRRTGRTLNYVAGATVIAGTLLLIPSSYEGKINAISAVLLIGGVLTLIVGVVMLYEGKNMMKNSGIKMSFFQYEFPPGPGISKNMMSAGIAIRL